MMDEMSSMLLTAAIVGVAACFLVLPIVALLRTLGLGKLRSRLDRLEEQVRRSRTEAQPGAEQAARESTAAAQLAELNRRLDQVEQAMRQRPAEQPAEVAPQEEVRPPVPSARRPRQQAIPYALPAEPEAAWQPDAQAVEEWVGRHGLGWAAMLLLLFAAAFFLKYAFENRWIGVVGRVAIGVLAGEALCLAGWRYHRRGWRIFSQVLTGGGVALLYLATYAAFGYYHLIPQSQAALFLVLLVAGSAAMASLYEAPAIALAALIGGLLVPLLLHTDVDQYRSLFAYLFVLNAGMAGLAFWRRWPFVSSVALVGTQLLFWMWFGEHYHPEKLAAALSFQSWIFLIYLGYATAAHWIRPERAQVEDLVRLVLNPGWFALAGYVMLDEDYHVWLGPLSVGMATVYTALACVALQRRREDARYALVLVATAMAFVAAAIPLEAHAAWIAVGWAVQGAVLWLFSLRIRAPALRHLGAVLLLFAVGRSVFVDTPLWYREPFVPILNQYALPALLVAACVLSVAAATRAKLRELGTQGEAEVLLSGMLGVGLLWFILSIETYTYFSAQMQSQGADASHLRQSAQTALSVVWGVYAAVLLAVGFRARSLALRWAALVVFAVTLVKVFLVDMAALPGLYRVLAFFVLAVMMAAAAWGYQKFQRLQTARIGSERT